MEKNNFFLVASETNYFEKSNIRFIKPTETKQASKSNFFSKLLKNLIFYKDFYGQFRNS